MCLHSHTSLLCVQPPATPAEPEAAPSSTYLREMERYAKMAPEKNEGSGRALVK